MMKSEYFAAVTVAVIATILAMGFTSAGDVSTTGGGDGGENGDDGEDEENEGEGGGSN